MKKIKIGVMGAYRGASMIRYCKNADNIWLYILLGGGSHCYNQLLYGAAQYVPEFYRCQRRN